MKIADIHIQNLSFFFFWTKLCDIFWVNKVALHNGDLILNRREELPDPEGVTVLNLENTNFHTFSETGHRYIQTDLGLKQ